MGSRRVRRFQSRSRPHWTLVPHTTTKLGRTRRRDTPTWPTASVLSRRLRRPDERALTARFPIVYTGRNKR